MVIDPDGAKLQDAAGTHGLEDVLCPDGGSQAIDDIVGLLQCFVHCAEAAYDDNRAEDFVLDDLGIVTIFCNHGWLEEKAFLQTRNIGTLATSHNVGTGSQGTLNKTFGWLAASQRSMAPCRCSLLMDHRRES